MKKQATFTALAIMFSISAFAVPPPGNSFNNAPIDAGILLLAAAGVTYGVYQIHKKRQKL